MLHPKYKRYFKQTFSFGLIWLIFGLVYVILEKGLLGELEYYPATKNKYDFKSSIIFAACGSFLVGLIQGWVEVVWLRKQLLGYALWVKTIVKSIFYLLFLLTFLMVLTIVTNMQVLNVGISDPLVYQNLQQFFLSFSFWSVFIYTVVTLNIGLFLSEIGDYIGLEVLSNFLVGKYHRPKQETRIFMFLDMKSSTTIAEDIGHAQYFELIKSCYADMTTSIQETSGEIYQYVGDEIVVSWTEHKGVFENNCIECFKKISLVFRNKKELYVTRFGHAPEFKGGFHIGEVTTGEIGVIKKDIIYTGDVLNTTSRIQGECNNYNSKALISEELVKQLSQTDSSYSFDKIGELLLRGKNETVQLYSFDFTELSKRNFQ